MATIITAIRCAEPVTGTDRIVDVRLNYMTERVSVRDVVTRISIGKEVFKSGSQSGPVVEVAYLGSTPYIRTEANGTTRDNLLSLPRYEV